jgi:hypothetical protein
LTIVGDSSPLHIWEPRKESFILKTQDSNPRSFLVVLGMSTVGSYK